jgi:hypothetical protein
MRLIIKPLKKIFWAGHRTLPKIFGQGKMPNPQSQLFVLTSLDEWSFTPEK